MSTVQYSLLFIYTLNEKMLTRRSAHFTPYGHEMQISTFAVCKLNMLQYLIKVKYTSHTSMVTFFKFECDILNQKEGTPNALENKQFFWSLVYALMFQD